MLFLGKIHQIFFVPKSRYYIDIYLLLFEELLQIYTKVNPRILVFSNCLTHNHNGISLYFAIFLKNTSNVQYIGVKKQVFLTYLYQNHTTISMYSFHLGKGPFYPPQSHKRSLFTPTPTKKTSIFLKLRL